MPVIRGPWQGQRAPLVRTQLLVIRHTSRPLQGPRV